VCVIYGRERSSLIYVACIKQEAGRHVAFGHVTLALGDKAEPHSNNQGENKLIIKNIKKCFIQKK